MKVFLVVILAFMHINVFSQYVVPLYEDSEVKICFKRYNDKYGYITEQYEGAYHGALVHYELKGEIFMLTELDDTVILADSLIVYSKSKSENDSLLLSSYSSVQEFPNAHGFFSGLTYIINDTLKVNLPQGNNDPDHQIAIRKVNTPYKLEMSGHNYHYGPFTVDSDMDVKVIIVHLLSIPNEYDFAKLLPETINLDGKRYKLKHTFEPWD